MTISFTGTRHGMTPEQRAWLADAFAKVSPPWAFHHGDCKSADAEAHLIAFRFGAWIVIHPPTYPYLRANLEGHEMRKEKNFLDQNKQIVRECDVLIAMPFESSEQENGGTWFTVRYAREVGRKLRVIGPDGVRIE